MAFTFSAPSVVTEALDSNLIVECHPEKGLCIFDTDRLLIDPRPRFKTLSIGDFDLYSACAYCLISKCWEDDAKIEIQQNRIKKTLRIQVISKETKWNSYSYRALEKNGNAFTMERAMNILNAFFGLIDSYEMDFFQRDAAAKPFANLLSRGYAHLTSSHSGFYVYDDFFYKDVLLVFRKIVSDCMISKNSWQHLNWFRRWFRGYRNYATFAHPELLE